MSKQKKYPTFAEAQKTAKSLGIKTAAEYKKTYRQAKTALRHKSQKS